MAKSVITSDFIRLKAQQAAEGTPVVLDEFIFANVPDLNPETPVSPDETLPPEDQIVHRQAVGKTGVVNENAVVYSVTLGAELGDFEFNWVGLVSKATSTLSMIVHA
ncbi:phage tail protein, partial [Escherichia coli]|nr:phage tail protein [Escherichia coli]